MEDRFFGLPRFRCAHGTIVDAPTHAGIFGLFDGDELIYVGRATNDAGSTIRDLLAGHCKGQYGSCTAKATHYTFEICLQPVLREMEVLVDFANRHRQAPRCQKKDLS